MKKIITLIMTAGVLFTGCKYDDDDLWNKVDDLDGRLKTLEQIVNQANTDISSLRTLVNAIETGNFVVGFNEKTDGSGWTLTLKNGDTIDLKHGSTGSNAPVIGVDLFEGTYYWTITIDGQTDWLTGDGVNKLPVTGDKGEAGAPGADAITPEIGIDQDGYWTVDYGDGKGPQQLTYGGYHVLAVTEGINSVIVDIKEYPNYITLVLANGSEIHIPRATRTVFEIDAYDEEVFYYGQEKTFKLTIAGATSFGANGAPNGWDAYLSRSDSTLVVTAPAQGSGSSRGEITLQAQGEDNIVTYLYVPVRVTDYELRILSFEGDYWETRIDAKQYSGPLLYGGSLSATANYMWWDENNTELVSFIQENWMELMPEYKYTNFSGGGEAVSDYVLHELKKNIDYNDQLSVYYKDASTGYGGRRGSKNFAVHFGYSDDSGLASANLSFIYFNDAEPRVVDHMWVTSTSYFASDILFGSDSYPYNDPLTGQGYINIVAIGYDENDEVSGRITFPIATGAGGPVLDWQKWELSGLGPVWKIEFDVEGDASNYNPNGFLRPAYFAYDDIAVRFPAPGN